MKVAIITGGNSGIGLATCKEFAQHGYIVYEISRHEQKENLEKQRIFHIKGDVTDENSLVQAFEQVYNKEGRIDVLVNNAGFGISGAIEMTSLDSAKKQFDVNFFGCFSASKLMINYMRKNGGGRIINMSSLAAPLAIPFQTMYSASKAAINSFTLALANEVKPFNIKVCAVMPGDIKTGFTAAREKEINGGGYYDDILKKSVARMEHDEQNGMTPQSIAKAVYKAATQKHPRVLRTVGISYRLFWTMAKFLPTDLVNTLVGKLYAE